MSPLLKNHPFDIDVSLSRWSDVMQFTSNKSGVLLQVVVVPLYGPFSRLNVHVLPCSLIRGDLADQLNLGGPTTSLDLFGVQGTSYLFTYLFI